MLAGYYCIDTFTPLSLNAYLAARSAVDCALDRGGAVLEGADLAYALVRPPGHHAERAPSAASAISTTRRSPPTCCRDYGRVAMLDVDYHHGNGPQDIFYTRSDVLTVSIHGHPSFAYPVFLRLPRRDGDGPGAGFNLNLPLPEHITPEQHRNAVAEALAPHRRFRAGLPRGVGRLRYGARRSDR